jgi:hypothetical protein
MTKKHIKQPAPARGTACPAPKGLTPRMRDLVQAVASLTEARGIAPSLEELARELRVHPSRVQRLACGAEASGALVRDARIPRSLRLPMTARENATATRRTT